MVATAKTSTINRATPLAHLDISHNCNDLESWPRSWMGLEKDLPPGEGLVACFRPFIEQLALSNLSQKTIRMHVDNLWGLGGEIIRDLNDTPSLRKVPVPRLLLKTIADGGPLLYHCNSEEQQRSFDSTCRKLRRFLDQSQPGK
jgi:hypothetical protein